jgi:glutathione S-transferase
MPHEDVQKRAKVDEALGAINDWRFAVNVLSLAKFWAKVLGRPAPPEAIVKGVEAQFGDKLTKLNGFLAGKKHLVGDHLTLADFLFVESFINGTVAGIDYPTLYPNI